jgi:GNAT superfamily N-acetyltransferase
MAAMWSTIRAPRLEELELLREIERAAGILFVHVDLAGVAAHEPETVEALAEYVRAGCAWVVAEDDVPLGYAVVDVVGGLAHLEQLSVHPDHGRKGLGATLLEHVCTWAAVRRYEAITLTTFAEVPWNAPFYAKHDFRVLTEAELGPELRALRAHEGELGLDPTRRVCMRRELEPPPR